MIDVFWTSLGLFQHPKDTFTELKTYTTKNVFMNGLFISIIGIISLFLGEILGHGNIAPHTVFFKLVAYYISSYLFLSVILFSLSLFHNKINTLQFLGLYLSTDVVLLAILPLSLLGSAIPVLSIVFKIGVYIIGFISWCLKLRLFMNYFKLSISQVIIIYYIPVLLLMGLGIMVGLVFFNTIVSFF